MIAIILVLFGAIATGQDLWDRHFNHAPSPPIGAAAQRQTIQQTGTIDGAPGTAIIDGVYVHSGKSSRWSWTIYTFLLLERNVTISVNAAGIGSSVYGVPHMLNPDHLQYWAGDPVSVVGTVDSPNQLSATAVSTQPNGFWSPLEDRLAVGLDAAFAGCVAALLVLHLWTSWRVRAHLTRVDSGMPFAYRPSQSPLQ